MENLLQPVEEKEFQKQVTIRFENINHGFNKYHNSILSSKVSINPEENFINFIYKAYELNGEGNSYFDFYLCKLDVEAKTSLLNLLNEEDKLVLQRCLKEIDENGLFKNIYFRLNKDILSFITRLCTRESLFSTFYFAKLPCTIWGNYNMRFPIFFSDYETIEKYYGIAEESGICIDN